MSLSIFINLLFRPRSDHHYSTKLDNPSCPTNSEQQQRLLVLPARIYLTDAKTAGR